MRQSVLQVPTYQDFESLKNEILALEERSEENLKTVNELSEDTQNSLDEIYLALSQLAIKKQLEQNSTQTQRKRIGFSLTEKK